jgi:hypothetical protein
MQTPFVIFRSHDMAMGRHDIRLDNMPPTLYPTVTIRTIHHCREKPLEEVKIRRYRNRKESLTNNIALL